MKFNLSSLSQVTGHLIEKMCPTRLPRFVDNKTDSIKKHLSIEGIVDTKFPTFLLSDGAVGLVWELTPIAHEMLTENELSHKLNALSELFRNVRGKNVSFQLIFDASPNPNFTVPDWFKEPDSLARKIQSERIAAISRFASAQNRDLRLMKRRLLLCLRLEDTTKLGTKSKFPNIFFDSVATTSDVRSNAIMKQIREIIAAGTSVEESLTRTQISFKRLGLSETNEFCATALHSLEFQASSPLFRKPSHEDKPLYDFIELQSHGVQVGDDTWETLSWVQKPPVSYMGMMARLLCIEEPIRVVLNLRRTETKSALETKLYLLKNSSDSQSERQREEVKQTLDRMEYGEDVFSASLHVLVRNEKKSLAEVKDTGAAKRVLENLYSYTGIPLIHEKHAAPAIFFSSLPLHYSPVMAAFNSRECLVLSKNLAFFLPVFCGFKGTGEWLKTQVMQNRAGEAIYLSSRASETSPHIALLAGSGAGKSFFLCNLLVSEIAAGSTEKGKSTLHFIIDRKTSYEVLARTLGEEIGFQIAKPPETFPNIFRGNLDTEGDRLRAIVNVLTTAITLVSKEESVDAVKANLLSLAIQKTFADLELDSNTSFESGKFEKLQARRAPIPKLSDVIDNLLPVCENEGYEKENVTWLRQQLAPFYGSGPYANLFDRTEFFETEDKTPGISLFDIDGVSNDKVLSTLTILVIIAEIVRQVKRPENKGRQGTITIEEAGVIGSSSPELISFIELIWKVFRKLGFTCIGLTNDSCDYKYKAACKTIWRMSPNKIVLRMLPQDIEEALSSSNGEVALFSEYLTGEVISSLRKKDGVYSQALWLSDEVKGSFTFVPTGFDYWLAASKPEEVQTVSRLAKSIPDTSYPYFAAVTTLARHKPFGFRNQSNEVVIPTDEELQQLSKKEVITC